MGPLGDSRIFPRISLSDFQTRKEEITSQLVAAAKGPGFFLITDHGISPSAITHMFSLSQQYFALPDATKSLNAFVREKNVGWEKQAQIRPSTGTPDQKESLQLQFGSSMEGKWPDDKDVKGFKSDALEFMGKCQDVSLKIMGCFADALDLPGDYFDKAHDVTKDDCLTVLRCLHYHDITGQTMPENYWRAGAHTGEISLSVDVTFVLLLT
jgi:isopenicillin N synthase-like dioxygenase